MIIIKTITLTIIYLLVLIPGLVLIGWLAGLLPSYSYLAIVSAVVLAFCWGIAATQAYICQVRELLEDAENDR